jgi:hypothetical protein
LITLVLANQPFAYAMQRLEIELVDSFDGDKLHGGSQHGFSDRFRVAEVVLLPFRIRSDIPGRHQPRVVAVRLELPAQVVRSNARLHAEEARPHIGEAVFDLAARQLPPQNNRAFPVEAN